MPLWVPSKVMVQMDWLVLMQKLVITSTSCFFMHQDVVFYSCALVVDVSHMSQLNV